MIGSVLTALLGLVAPAMALGREIVAEKQAAREAESDKERLDHEERVRRLEGLRDVMLSERGFAALIRPLIALPFVIFLWKVIVWDKVLSLGTTDPLTGQIAEWAPTIILSYFLAETIQRFRR